MKVHTLLKKKKKKMKVHTEQLTLLPQVSIEKLLVYSLD